MGKNFYHSAYYRDFRSLNIVIVEKNQVSWEGIH